jgi:hypothetical protein
MMRYRAIEASGFGNMPRSVRRQGPLRKSERNRPDCKPATTRTLRGPRPETDWNVGWRRGGGGSAGWRRGRISDEKLSKSPSKHHFLRSCQKFKKTRKTFLAGISIFLKFKLLNKFSCNLRSKSARSTLTSPGLIRIKEI